MHFRKPFLRLSAVLAATTFVPLPGWAKNVTVDCSGATPGAFRSMQAAINSLSLAGPNYITVASNPCHEDVQIVDRQRLTIDAPNGNAFITSAEDLGGDAMTITGSTGITLLRVGFYASGRGLVINGNSTVHVAGCTSDSNAGAGIRIDDSSVVVESGAYINNGNIGILANDSTLTLADLEVYGNVNDAIVLHRTHGTITRLNIHDNGEGLLMSNGADERLDAPNTIVNNQLRGVSVVTGSTLHVVGSTAPDGTPLTNVIDGNGWIGLNIGGGVVYLIDSAEISNNGSNGGAFHAGIQVTDNGLLVTAGTGNILVSRNTGPGIEAQLGASVDLTGTTVTGNAGDGVRVLGNSRFGIFPPNTNVVRGNGGRSVNCDSSSIFFGDASGINGISCRAFPAAASGLTNRRAPVD